MGTVSNINVFKNDPSPTVGEGLSTLRDNQTAFREMVGALPPVTVTALGDNFSLPVKSASIILDVPNNSEVRLISIRGNLSGEVSAEDSEFHNGMVIKLWGVSGKTVTLKHKGNNSVASYNIRSIDNADIVLSPTIPTVLTYDSDNNIWIERERTSTILSDTTGDLTNLTTTNKTNLVAAINEVKGNTSTNATNISNLSSKVGTGTINNKVTNTNVVVAINDLITKIGLPLSSLDNSLTKTSLITAINSLVTLKANTTDVGILNNLTTTEKSSIVGAINELKSTSDTNIGILSSLLTTNKDSVVAALNELYGTDGVVHKSGNESINGEKVFTNNVFIKHTNIDHTTLPATDKYRGIYFIDTNDVILSRIMFYKNANGTSGLTLGVKAHNTSDYISGLGFYITQDGGVSVSTQTPSSVSDDSTKIATTAWVRDATGDFACNAATATKATQDVDGNAIKTTYAKLASPTFTGTPKAPTASAGTNTTQLATTAFVSTAITNATTLGTASRVLITDSNKKIAVSSVTSTELGYLSGVTSAIQTQINAKAADNAVVHLSGTETITGEKTFSSNFNVAAQSPVLRLQSTTLDTTTTSSSTQIMYAVVFTDKNGTDAKYRTGHIRSGMTSNDCNFIHMHALNPTTNSTAFAGISVYYSRDGKAKAVAPSTLLSSDVTNSTLDIDDTDIITRDFIPKDTRIVHTTGNETIGGTKTFSSTISGSIDGNAATATKLTTPRNLKVDLSSTTEVTFDGSANQNAIPISNILPVANGGTGINGTIAVENATDFDDVMDKILKK